MRRVKKQSGFTLVEVLLYLALMGIILGGALAAAFQILQNSEVMRSKTLLEEEGNFLLAKINWALTGSSAVSGGGIAFTATKFDSSMVSYRFNGTDLESNKSGSYLPLNGSAFRVSGLNFTPTTDPKGIAASFTLTTIDENGRQQALNFQTTKNLRK